MLTDRLTMLNKCIEDVRTNRKITDWATCGVVAPIDTLNGASYGTQIQVKGTRLTEEQGLGRINLKNTDPTLKNIIIKIIETKIMKKRRKMEEKREKSRGELIKSLEPLPFSK